MNDFRKVFYDLKAKAEARRSETAAIMAKYAYDIYVQTRPEVKKKRCLDVGTGSGWAMESLLAAGCKSCDGIDVSSERVLQTKAALENKNYKNFKVWVDSAEELGQCPSNHYDYCNYLDIIEHLVDYRKGIQQVRRVLKRKGVVYIKTPNHFTDHDLKLHHYGEELCSLLFPQKISQPQGTGLMLRNDTDRLSDNEMEELTDNIPEGFSEHIHQFYPEELRDLVEEEGFEIIRMTGTPLFSDILFNHEKDTFQNLVPAYVALLDSAVYNYMVQALFKDIIASKEYERFRGLPPHYVLSDNLILIARAR